MATEITPRKVQQAVQRGRKRLANFRQARLMFLRQYVGQYYDKDTGEIGTEALNLIFNAIRSLVPHIVMNFPKHNLETPYIGQRQYGDLLGNALSQQDKKLNMKDAYRRCIVDAIFSLGILKTGLAQSDSIYVVDEDSGIDAGTIYSQPVDFDNLIVDPSSREHLFIDASFVGDCMAVPRDMLLGSGLFKNDLVERLPRMSDGGETRVSSLSMKGINAEENYELEDMVEIAEIWVPSAKALIYVPARDDVQLDDYLRIDDYYGVKEGPYTFLGLTPPVPGNPIPVPMVGIWADLHVLANKMAKKVVDQAMRQKDVVVYKRASADDALELKDAKDGEAVACDDPSGVEVKSFGGQQNSNEAHLQQLQLWFNYMAGNPDQLAGSADNSDTATQAKILSNNSNVGLDDMKDLVYQFAAAEARKRAWYLDSDPMLNIPLTRRVQNPAQYAINPMGMPFVSQPAMMNEEQVVLTPELRNGDFLDFTFSIEPESMGRKDSSTRLAQAMDFAVKLLPAIAGAAQIMMQLGMPFSVKAFLLRMAKYAGIDWMDEVFYDPEFQQQMMMQMMQGPQQAKADVQPGGPPGMPGMGGPGLGAPNMNAQMMQNGQPAAVGAGQPGVMEQMMSEFQQGAVPAQQALQRGY